jgi:hypothetical protein
MLQGLVCIKPQACIITYISVTFSHTCCAYFIDPWEPSYQDSSEIRSRFISTRGYKQPHRNGHGKNRKMNKFRVYIYFSITRHRFRNSRSSPSDLRTSTLKSHPNIRQVWTRILCFLGLPGRCKKKKKKKNLVNTKRWLLRSSFLIYFSLKYFFENIYWTIESLN